LKARIQNNVRKLARLERNTVDYFLAEIYKNTPTPPDSETLHLYYLPPERTFNQISTMITRLSKITLVALIFATTISFPSWAGTSAIEDWAWAEPHSGESVFDQINRQEIVEMTLVGNLDSIINVRKTKTYSKAKFTYIDEYGIARNYDVKVKPRGKFRRRVCDFPPLKIKFSKDQLEAAGLSKHNDLKLVTHCMDSAEFNESLVLREYLAYKLYNELTPNSFRVQLMKITYQDKNDKLYKVTQYGFLIEDVDELAERMGGVECDDCLGLATEQIDSSNEKIASMFEYLIGNTDWSFDMARNIKLIKMPNGSHIPIPYDFDFSVLVNAPYLRPNTDLNQTSNMERIYTGLSANANQVYATVSYFKTKRDALLDIIHGFHFLSKNDRFAAELYIESFYDSLDTRENAGAMIFKAHKLTGLR